MKKTAIITGADGGMGTEITRAVAMAGYRILMLCFTREKGELRRRQLMHETGNYDIESLQIDLSSLASIDEKTDLIRQKVSSIELLMNNAGTMANRFITTQDGLERTVAVNYVAPYFLTRKLLPLMHRGTRIVNMVSCTYAIGKIGPHFFTHGTEGNFWRIPIYSNTKLALWLFTRELAQRLREQGISVNAADPGVVSTQIIHMNMWFDPLTDLFFRPCIRTPRQGADMAIRLLLNKEYEGETGKMYVSQRMRRLKEKFLNHKQMKSLWNETEKLLNEKGFLQKTDTSLDNRKAQPSQARPFNI